MVFENTHKFLTPFWGSYNHFQALEATFLKSLGLIYAYSNMNIPLDIQIKKIVAAPSSGRILQLRKNHCAIQDEGSRMFPYTRPGTNRLIY